jgi:hypothetical protein
MRQAGAFVALAAALVLGGCATITRGTTDQLQINSEPPNAIARTSIGHSCVTPCTITISRKDEFSVVISKAGYEDQTIDVKTQVAGAGAAGFAGNILLGGVVGMGADVATGAALEHIPNPVNAQLVPLPRSPAPSRPPPRPRRPSEAPIEKPGEKPNNS